MNLDPRKTLANISHGLELYRRRAQAGTSLTAEEQQHLRFATEWGEIELANLSHSMGDDPDAQRLYRELEIQTILAKNTLDPKRVTR